MGGRSIAFTGNDHSIYSQPESNRIAWLKLKLVPGLGNRSVLRLLELYGSPENILAASQKDLKAAGVLREGALQALSSKRFIRDPEAEWEKLRAQGVRLLCLADADYPSNLAQIHDAPAVLFVSGRIEPRDLVSVAVVGSRYASPAGIIFTEKLCYDLAVSGVTVVSGFAVGIDSAGHRGTLKAGGRTIAVLGCGLDVNYPSINSDLKVRIGGTGAIVSEFPLGTPPVPGNFPSRNRIISGLSLGVVVVEATEKSGSLITARMALEQGREVFAVPGVAQSLRSTGTHRLLKQGAKLVDGIEDILEEIRPLLKTGNMPVPGPVPEPPPKPTFAECGGDDSILLRVLDKVPKHIDEIVRDAGIPVQKAAAMLLSLELRGLVSQLPGKYFISSNPGK